MGHGPLFTDTVRNSCTDVTDDDGSSSIPFDSPSDSIPVPLKMVAKLFIEYNCFLIYSQTRSERAINTSEATESNRDLCNKRNRSDINDN